MLQSKGTSCGAADRRPDEAWGSLPGTSAARILIGELKTREGCLVIHSRFFWCHQLNGFPVPPTWADQFAELSRQYSDEAFPQRLKMLLPVAAELAAG